MFTACTGNLFPHELCLQCAQATCFHISCVYSVHRQLVSTLAVFVWVIQPAVCSLLWKQNRAHCLTVPTCTHMVSPCPNLQSHCAPTCSFIVSPFAHCLTKDVISEPFVYDLGVAAWMLTINFFGHISLACFLLTSYFGTTVTSSLKLFCWTHHRTEASNNTLWHGNGRTVITNFNQQINWLVIHSAHLNQDWSEQPFQQTINLIINHTISQPDN